MFLYLTEESKNFPALHTKARTLSLKNQSNFEVKAVKGENWVGQRGRAIFTALPLPNQRLNQTRNYVLSIKPAK